MRGEEPLNKSSGGRRESENQQRQKNEGSVRGDDKRTDGGLDLTGPGRLPQPA